MPDCDPSALMDNRKAEIAKAEIATPMARWRAEEGREWPGDPKSWKDLAQAAYKKQLAPREWNRERRRRFDEGWYTPKRKTAPKDGLSKIDNPSARRSRLTER